MSCIIFSTRMHPRVHAVRHSIVNFFGLQRHIAQRQGDEPASCCKRGNLEFICPESPIPINAGVARQPHQKSHFGGQEVLKLRCGYEYQEGACNAGTGSKTAPQVIIKVRGSTVRASWVSKADLCLARERHLFEAKKQPS